MACVVRVARQGNLGSAREADADVEYAVLVRGRLARVRSSLIALDCKKQEKRLHLTYKITFQRIYLTTFIFASC